MTANANPEPFNIIMSPAPWPHYVRPPLAVAGPAAWNSLPGPVRDPNSTDAAFRRLLKTFLFARY